MLKFRSRGEPPTHDISASHDVMEESILTLLRQRYPSYLKMDGKAARRALDRAFIRFVLERCRGNHLRASEAAGCNRNTLRSRIRQYGIDWKSYLNS